MNNTIDFHPGDRVLYVPNHAHGDSKHPDCERGLVSSTNAFYVFVRYIRKDGSTGTTAQATNPEDLLKVAS